MRISGFTMVRNATQLFYPIKQSILSILPLVDEYVVALGGGHPDDQTEAEIRSIGSPKIKLIHTVWDIEAYPNGTENAHQTDLAKAHCKGDWLFYLQADEVVHEKYLPVIETRCRRFLDDPQVEGMLFDYVHFWGDFQHFQDGHGWYKKEIRLIRNRPDIHSWESAQSFRRIPDFDGRNYRQQQGTFKLKVVKANASIFHYGWARPPGLMASKKKALDTIHKGEKRAAELHQKKAPEYDYGPLGRAKIYQGTHPAVMQNWLEKFDWAKQLNYSKKDLNPLRDKHKHDSWKYRILTFIEQKVLFGKELGSFKNYELLQGKKYR